MSEHHTIRPQNNDTKNRAASSSYNKEPLLTIGPISVNRKVLFEYVDKMGKENVRKAVEDTRRWNNHNHNRQQKTTNTHPSGGDHDMDMTTISKNAFAMGRKNRHGKVLQSRPENRKMVANSHDDDDDDKTKKSTRLGKWDHDSYFDQKGQDFWNDRRQKIALQQQKLRHLKK
ncbi:expressed unknown protein [Seminavis robusta]|uniref:Uncharacterized protein n=1 Tax=Seminavis robusta TaxID=568900 RepID=A0A9N8E640_9STRA|nr:expressed unknown protein [Seminavis robusta]|eukprot:Sro700_g189650.1 n/a (173) ;mRNA; r:32846-33453